MQEEYEVIMNEYRRVKFEKQKGAKKYGLWQEDINEVLQRLEKQLIDKGIEPYKLI